MLELRPDTLIFRLLSILLVECDNIDNRLRVLFLFSLCDTAVIEHALPFWR